MRHHPPPQTCQSRAATPTALGPRLVPLHHQQPALCQSLLHSASIEASSLGCAHRAAIHRAGGFPPLPWHRRARLHHAAGVTRAGSAQALDVCALRRPAQSLRLRAPRRALGRPRASGRADAARRSAARLGWETPHARSRQRRAL